MTLTARGNGAPKDTLGRDHCRRHAGRTSRAADPGRRGRTGRTPVHRPFTHGPGVLQHRHIRTRLRPGVHGPCPRGRRRRARRDAAAHRGAPPCLDESPGGLHRGRARATRLRPGGRRREATRTDGHTAAPRVRDAGGIGEASEHPCGGGRPQRRHSIAAGGVRLLGHDLVLAPVPIHAPIHVPIHVLANSVTDIDTNRFEAVRRAVQSQEPQVEGVRAEAEGERQPPADKDAVRQRQAAQECETLCSIEEPEGDSRPVRPEAEQRRR
ncbi:hypothetical protein SAMN05443665_102522 [Actinomadura meyerae]|uniref:Uncharacterized protein n=1 Tax=Actinomadura meyerae TaxID=240840 RepID=A0A239LZ77_9ACTN|nr:hypothetical protein SAMN05443665_102522 [Actinomadura meyerae]